VISDRGRTLSIPRSDSIVSDSGVRRHVDVWPIRALRLMQLAALHASVPAIAGDASSPKTNEYRSTELRLAIS
jgi:hypothetical protein